MNIQNRNTLSDRANKHGYKVGGNKLGVWDQQIQDNIGNQLYFD